MTTTQTQPVFFVGAGPGDPELLTLKGRRLLDEAELVVYADKLCTDEETVRLKNHIETMKKDLEKGGALGRKLDFLAQEMNREANTIGSKANNLEITSLMLQIKAEIEKIREQVQNIE